MPEHYDVTLEVRYFALLSDVATARVTPTDATSFICDEIRRAFERGKQRVTAPSENEKTPQTRRARTQSV